MKKVLAFVLVLAMVLGSVSMAFAADFTDQSSITNGTAAKVLNAAGILEGYTDGSFQPTNILTRAEGATIVARMLLGKAEAAKLTTVVGPFADVPASHWAAGYISYAVAQGILDGYGNGNFGPEDPLTVAQFGKMMLTALGYKSANEGFTGANWETNVGSVMVKAGLTDGVTLSGSNYASRDVAAQVALNTLKATLVQYDGTPVTVNAGGVSVTTGQSAAKAVTAADTDGIANAAYIGNAGKAGTLEFMEKYQHDLKYTSAGKADELGRPDTFSWTWKNKTAADGKKSNNLVASFDTKTTRAKMYDAVGKDVYKKITDGTTTSGILTVFRNGNQLVATAAAAAVNTYIDKDSTSDVGNINTKIEVYVSDTNNVTVVMYDYFAVKAAAKYDKDDEKLALNTTYSTMGGVTLPTELKAEDWPIIKDAAKGDWFYLTMGKNGATSTVIDVAKATTVQGNVDAYVSGKTVTLDGTVYNVAGTAATKTASADTIMTVVLDGNNNVLAIAEAKENTNYVYLAQIATDGALTASGQVAGLYFTDGTYKEVKVKSTVSTKPGIYAYSIDSNGKYKLTTPAAVLDSATKGGVKVSGIVNKAVNFAAGANLAAKDDTVFVVINNPLKSDAKINTYTGYKNVPKITGAAVGGIGVYYAVKDGFVTTAFIIRGNANISNSTSDYVVVYGKGVETRVESNVNEGAPYTVYTKVLVNGEKASVGVDATGMAQVTSGAMYIEPQYSSEGLLTGATNVVGAGNNKYVRITAALTSKSAISQSGSVLTIDGTALSIAEDAKIIVIDGTTVKDTTADMVGTYVKKFTAGGGQVFVIYDNETDKNVTTLIVLGD